MPPVMAQATGSSSPSAKIRYVTTARIIGADSTVTPCTPALLKTCSREAASVMVAVSVVTAKAAAAADSTARLTAMLTEAHSGRRRKSGALQLAKKIKGSGLECWLGRGPSVALRVVPIKLLFL